MEPYRGCASEAGGSCESTFIAGGRAFSQVVALTSDGGGEGASGDFDYLREETDGSDGVDVDDEGNAYGSEPDLDYLLADGEPKAHDGFDAFDENTWDEDFTPVSVTRGTGPRRRAP